MQRNGIRRRRGLDRAAGKHQEQQERERSREGIQRKKYGAQKLLKSNPGNHQGIPESHKLLALLKDCAKRKDLEAGIKLHAEIAGGLLVKDNYIGSALINLYANCGLLEKARKVFEQIQDRDVVTWTALVSGYAQHGYGEDALECFEKMQQQGLSPNEVTFLAILKACGTTGAIDKGAELHAEIVKHELLKKSILLGTTLVDMYSKCGALAKAQEVFDQISFQDVISWTALIAGYIQHEHNEEALACFERMQCEGLAPNAITLTCILKACRILGVTDKGKRMHVTITKEGTQTQDISVGNALVDFYAKCNDVKEAQKMFDELPIHDVISWNAIITGYSDHGYNEKALQCFEWMQHEGLCPDASTYVCTLRACGILGAIQHGQEMHGNIIKRDLLETDVFLVTALMSMYAECGAVPEAEETFSLIVVRDVVMWTALMAAYAEDELSEKTFSCFERMQCEGVSPNEVTFVCVLKACDATKAARKGNEMHAKVFMAGLLPQNKLVGNAVVEMYARCGMLAKSQEVFNKLLAQDAVSWNSLISGYAQVGQAEAALQYFTRMQQEGCCPDVVTFACILKGCANIAAIYKGKEIHARIARDRMLEKEILIGNAMVDLYAKCGAPEQAREVFDELSVQDTAAWTALIAGYGQHGRDNVVIDLFDKMIELGLEPNEVLYTVVLNACSHSGLLDKGQMYFEIMTIEHEIEPKLEHFACMVDLFGRAGQFCKVMAIISEMPTYDHFPVWTSLLGACSKWGNVELGNLAFEHMIRLDKKCAAAYICMNKLHTAVAMQEGVKEENRM